MKKKKKKKKKAQKPVSESHGSEGGEASSPPQLSDSLCCKNNREITQPTHAKYEGEYEEHFARWNKASGEDCELTLTLPKRGHIIASDFSSSN